MLIAAHLATDATGPSGAVIGIAGVLGVAVIVFVAAFSKRLGIAAPILLVLVGFGISYLPGLPAIEVPPELVLDGLLPPILYAAALNLPLVDFRRNLGTIVSLSVVLVVVTAFGTGFLLFELLPFLSLWSGIALGAVISPPDAVAATSIGRRLGLPPRILTVLEGEGLVNDATALVLLTTAATLGVSKGATVVNGWAISGDFVYAVVVAVAIGLAAGALTVWVRSKLDDAVLGTAVSLAVPFVAFAPTVFIGASGVLAVVVAGLYTGYANPGAFSPQIRISERINWRTIQFLLENGVFLLIGLQIRTLIEQANSDPENLSVAGSFGLGLLLTAALVLLRFFWVGPLIYLLKLREQRAEKTTLRRLLALQHDLSRQGPRTRLRRRQHRVLERRYNRKRNDLEQLRGQGIDWRSGIVLSWSGMRGVVTLAAAQTLPDTTPYRPQLILIAFTVAVATLLLQGSTLPALIRVLRITGIDEVEDRRMLAALLDEMSFSGLSVLDDASGAVDGIDEIDPDIVERVRQSSFLRAESAWERSRGQDAPLDETPHRVYRRLRLAVVQAERERLLAIRSAGTYPARIEDEAQALLDLEETRLRPSRAAE
jgi:monovalent cation/hydrogen antiporter